jgi:hypothetical protein
MPFSTCSSRDFFHPEFERLRELIGGRQLFQRKLWEWVFIVHQAIRTGAVGPSKRALAFGVGREVLPAVFARMGARVTATDAPPAIAAAAGWQASGVFVGGLAHLPAKFMNRAAFEALVEWRDCDMNAIDPALTDYDFCWSSCSLEHLGSLEHGLDFIIESVEKTLRVGG